MRIIEYYAENFKRLRLVEFKPKGRVTMFTGRNDQGKSSALDAVAYVLGGKKWSPEVPTRRGAQSHKVKLGLNGEKGTFTVTRTQSGLKLEMAPGTKAWDTPQAMLDSIFDELALDPIEFIHMKPKEQVEMLRRCVKLDVDIDKLNQENLEDFQKRREVNREVERLKSEAAAIPIQDGLPKEKQDEEAILTQISSAGETNKNVLAKQDEKARTDRASRDAFNAAQSKAEMAAQKDELRKKFEAEIKKLDAEIIEIEEEVAKLNTRSRELAAMAEAIEVPAPADMPALMQQLQQVQLINREIDKRTRREAIQAQHDLKDREARQLTRAMEDREEKKRAAIMHAEMPVPGLTFNEDEVLFEGIPLQQLGEAKQIRISVALVLARNPKLRLVRIPHGESLDEESIAELAKLAEEQDFYVWMARVDSSGTMGIVIEDGEVKAVNEN